MRQLAALCVCSCWHRLMGWVAVGRGCVVGVPCTGCCAMNITCTMVAGAVKQQPGSGASIMQPCSDSSRCTAMGVCQGRACARVQVVVTRVWHAWCVCPALAPADDRFAIQTWQVVVMSSSQGVAQSSCMHAGSQVGGPALQYTCSGGEGGCEGRVCAEAQMVAALGWWVWIAGGAGGVGAAGGLFQGCGGRALHWQLLMMLHDSTAVACRARQQQPRHGQSMSQLW